MAYSVEFYTADELPAVLDSALDDIIRNQEGGWILESDPRDRDGGWTFGGMTANEFHENGYPWTLEYMHFCVEKHPDGSLINEANFEHAKEVTLEIYDKKFINTVQWDKIPKQLVAPFLSCIINCGLEGGSKSLQRSLAQDSPVDGRLGPKSLAALQRQTAKFSVSSVLREFFVEWKYHYDVICDPKQGGKVNPAYHAGLINRVKYWENKS